MDIMFRSSPHFPPLCWRSSRDHVNEIICSKITHTELITQNSSNCSGSEPGSLRRSWWLWEGAQGQCCLGKGAGGKGHRFSLSAAHNGDEVMADRRVRPPENIQLLPSVTVN